MIMIKSNKSLFVKLFKYIPPISTFILTIHVSCLLIGYSIPFTLLIIDSSFLGGLLLIISSIIFDMCLLHKLCIGYICLVTICIDLQKLIGFGSLLTLFRWIVLIIGIILIILLIVKHVRKNIILDIKKDSR